MIAHFYLLTTCSISFLSTVIPLMPTVRGPRSHSPAPIEPTEGQILRPQPPMVFAHCAAYMIALDALHKSLVVFSHSLCMQSPIKTYT